MQLIICLVLSYAVSFIARNTLLYKSFATLQAPGILVYLYVTEVPLSCYN